MIDLFKRAACAVNRATLIKSPCRVACNDCWRTVCSSRFKVLINSGVIFAVVIVLSFPCKPDRYVVLKA